MIVPFLIIHHGLFTLLYDFNSQQLTFNMHANNAVHNGNILWDWNTDLGSNFIGSYSFYVLGSPFFWLGSLFPSSAFPYIAGPMFMLKYCVAGITSYSYIEQYIKNKKYAIIGALLYAFSGFTTINLIFNHFHDVVALFPLILLGIDKLIQEKNATIFIIAVAVNALVNYVFFFGEIIFVSLYFCIRYLSVDFKKYIKSTPKIIIVSIIGVGISSVLLLPSIMFTLQNPRLSILPYGFSSLIYSGNRYLSIVKALLMPADIMASQSAIIQQDYSSSSAYIPLFGISLVLAFMFGRKIWLKRIIISCLIIGTIPILNSSFYFFNAEYYARWFYMPLLFFSLATAIVLDNTKVYNIKMATSITFIATTAFVLFVLFFPITHEKVRIIYHYKLFLIYALISFSGLFFTYMIVIKLRSAQIYYKLLLISVLIFSVVPATLNIYRYQKLEPRSSEDIFSILSSNISLPRSGFYRVSYPASTPNQIYFNLSLISGYPSVSSFNSTVNGSIFNFYKSLNLTRRAASSPPSQYYGLNTLFSDKYIFSFKKQQGIFISKVKVGSDQLYIYRNPYFLPMGFSYDYYLSKNEFLNVPANKRHLVLLKAIIVSKQDIPFVKKQMLKPLQPIELKKTDYLHYKIDFNHRKRESSYFFRKYNYGFTSKLKSNKEKMTLFSVPFDTGWSASVNGKRVKIMDSDGMMSVPVIKGNNTIIFKYNVPGLQIGFIISIISITIFFMYMVIRFLKRKGQNNLMKKVIYR